jgi:hypothetical protein
MQLTILWEQIMAGFPVAELTNDPNRATRISFRGIAGTKIVVSA